MRRSTPRVLMPALVLPAALGLLLLSACGGGSGGGGGGGAVVIGKITVAEVEPNNTVGTAGALVIGQAGRGDLSAPGDVDFWSITTAAPSFVRIEVSGARLDQTMWSGTGNAPVLTVFDTDGTTKIAEHDNNADVITDPSTTTGGLWDRDFDCLRLPAAGTYYIRVVQDAPAAIGGPYVLAVSDVTVPGVQLELEGEGMSGANNTTATAEGIATGAMQGYMTSGDVDVYAFNVVGVPAVAVFDVKAWRHGAQAGATGYRHVDLFIVASDGVTPLEATPDTFGYGFDPHVSQLITAPGGYFLVVTDASTAGTGPGRYQLHYDLRQVGGLLEAEPNNLPGGANALAPGQFVSGTCAAANPDWFSFQATAGDRRAIRVWNGNNHAAPTATNAVAATVFAPNGVTVLPAAQPGTPTAYGLWELRFLTPTTGTYFVRVDTGGAATDYTIRNVLVAASGAEAEPNGALPDANPLVGGTTISGAIDPAADADWFSFTAEADEHVIIDCHGGSNGGLAVDLRRDLAASALAPSLNIVDGAMMSLATSTRTITTPKAHGLAGLLPTVSVSFVAPASGTYYVVVGDSNASGGPNHVYQLIRR